MMRGNAAAWGIQNRMGSRSRRFGERDDSIVEYSVQRADDALGRGFYWATSTWFEKIGREPEGKVEVLPALFGDLILDDLLEVRLQLRNDHSDLFAGGGDFAASAISGLDRAFGQDFRDFADGFDMSAMAARVDVAASGNLAAAYLGDFG